jgi:hypothetical protein
MADLSPAAQAVLDAFLGGRQEAELEVDELRRQDIAFALRAAADQLHEDIFVLLGGVHASQCQLREIADELEGHDAP